MATSIHAESRFQAADNEHSKSTYWPAFWQDSGIWRNLPVLLSQSLLNNPISGTTGLECGIIRLPDTNVYTDIRRIAQMIAQMET